MIYRSRSSSCRCGALGGFGAGWRGATPGFTSAGGAARPNKPISNSLENVLIIVPSLKLASVELKRSQEGGICRKSRKHRPFGKRRFGYPAASCEVGLHFAERRAPAFLHFAAQAWSAVSHWSNGWLCPASSLPRPAHGTMLRA